MISDKSFWGHHMGRGLSEYSVALDAKIIRSSITDVNSPDKERFIIDAGLSDKEFFGKWLDVHLLLEEFLSQE